MLFNYFKIAWRNLLRNKAFSFINISGLAIGMASTMLIFLWVYNERSWDKTHENYNNIYHVLANRDFNGQITTGQDMMYPLAKAAKENIPGVQFATIVSFEETKLLSVGDKKINRNTLTVSPDFFNVFTFNTILGDKEAAVKDPNALILTESTAKALFGHTNVIGQAVEVSNKRTAFVKAVIEDAPRNGTLQFEGLVPFNSSSPEIKEAENEWVNCGNRIFFKTINDASVSQMEQKVLQLIKERTEGDNPTTKGSVILHPMEKWRLYSDFEGGKNVGGRIEYVNLFTWIAVIILVIACVNFMNLSTARSEKRAKEVGIRKTLGSERSHLFWQFMAESVLLALFGFVIAVAIVLPICPAFSALLNEDIVIPFASPYTWLFVVGMVLITGLLAGSYPAIYLSGFNPVKVLKGTFLPGKQAMLPRKVLVTSQFIVSIVLISATLIIFQQLQFVKNRNWGYDQNNLIMVNSTADTDKSYESLRNDLLASGQVAAVNKTSAPITNVYMSTSGINWKGAPPSSNLVIGFVFAGENFASTLGTKVISGRDFKAGDSNTVMFNKAAIETMGLKDPVGKTINWAGKDRLIVGLIDNMIMTSPYAPSDPLMVAYEDRWSGRLNIRLVPEADISRALAVVENIYKKYSSEYPFEYRFVDEDFAQKFTDEQLIGKLSIIFAGLAIFICCLGLFGLVASTIERRKKEIGIRKVLGASVQQLLYLMSKEFLLLVAIAFFVAIPTAWLGMNKWLENFAYRINIHLSLFFLVGLLILLIALITVALNASKAALKTPVTSLRNE
jgi:ABC-type antimicrobial peptide transport system permease subunit